MLLERSVSVEIAKAVLSVKHELFDPKPGSFSKLYKLQQ